jgi:hypothetical protein
MSANEAQEAAKPDLPISSAANGKKAPDAGLAARPPALRTVVERR